MADYGGKVSFKRKPFLVDAFIVRTNLMNEITNYDSLKKWIGNSGFLHYSVFKNAEGCIAMKVHNVHLGREEIRVLHDHDVLYHVLKDGKRDNEAYCPIWDYSEHFFAIFDKNYD